MKITDAQVQTALAAYQSHAGPDFNAHEAMRAALESVAPEPEPDIVPGSEEALIRVEARPVGGDPSFGQKITVRRAEPQHGQTGYATGNGYGHG